MSIDTKDELGLVELIESDDVYDRGALDDQLVEEPGKNVVFISYRRRYRAHADLLRRHLDRRYGSKRVFIDSTVPGAVRWRQHLQQQLDQTKIMVVLVGPQWPDEFATRERMGKPDWSRWELLDARAGGTPVLPVCVGGATIPEAAELPPDLRWVVGTQAVVVHPDHRRAGYRKVCRAMDKQLGWWARRLHRNLVLAAVVAMLVAIAVLLYQSWQARQLPVFDDAERVILIAPGAETASAAFPPAETEFAQRFVEDLAAELDVDLDDNIRVETLEPSQAELAVNSAAEVDRILTTTNADLLIAGHLERRSNHSDYLPAIFVGRIDGIEELFGESVSFAADDVRRRDQDIAGANAAVRTALLRNAAVALQPTGQLVQAMDAVALRDPALTDAAMGTLLDGREHLLDADAWPLYVLRGNARLVLLDFDGADGDFQSAVELDPGAARARLGLAEVGLARATMSGCAPAAALLAILEASQAHFEHVHNTVTSGGDAGLVVKATVGQGRVDMCRSRSLASGSMDAQVRFASGGISLIDEARSVFDEIPTAQSTVAETMAVGLIEAAETHLDLAAVGQGAGDEALHAAIEALDETAGGALAISTRPLTKARAWMVMRDVHAALGDTARQEQARQEACASLDAVDAITDRVTATKATLNCRS